MLFSIAQAPGKRSLRAFLALGDNLNIFPENIITKQKTEKLYKYNFHESVENKSVQNISFFS